LAFGKAMRPKGLLSLLVHRLRLEPRAADQMLGWAKAPRSRTAQRSVTKLAFFIFRGFSSVLR
jgi:hypothetical protein